MTSPSSPALPTSPSSTFDALAWQLWGKADPSRNAKDGPTWHPLLCHMVDVASVARRMLQGALPASVGDQFTAAMGLKREDALAWLCFWVALHDLGKVSPAFQAKWEPGRKKLKALGLEFEAPDGAAPHGVLTVVEGPEILEKHFGHEYDLGIYVARAVGAHHGEFPTDISANAAGNRRERGKTETWGAARLAVVDLLAQVFAVPRDRPPSAALAAGHGFFMLLSGLTAVADWIGSMAEVFVYEPDTLSLEVYAKLAAMRAEDALQRVGWRDMPPRGAPRSFVELFEDSPWPLHDATATLVGKLRGPSLLIIEAPMGEGKTEAALLAAEHLRVVAGNQGLFIGLPTQATSNQMFGRVKRFLERTQGGDISNLHLVHGEAALVAEYQALRVQAIYDDSQGTRGGAVVAEEWFARSKRALLASYAVGTVDQALLGVLRVRHSFVRLFGASGKTVILDEVHAYDTYTSTLIDRLVEWLAAMGASVVLLSATLPSRRRAALMKAFGGSATAPAARAPYPRISWVSGGLAGEETTGCRRPPVPVSLEAVGPHREAVARALGALLDEGGCAAWICNTVDRAQQAYRELRELRTQGLLAADTELSLLHARFPFEDRQQREIAAEASFGRKGKRPRRAILIGTQVLEQSLDLDFDVMVSDYAPVDLLLQRSGRLHRHERDRRPTKLATPRFLVVQPEHPEAPDGPSFREVAVVYEELVMLRTWLALRDRGLWTLPNDLEPLIEEVYGDGALPADLSEALRKRIEAATAQFERQRQDDERSAKVRMLPDPRSKDDIFGNLRMPYEENAPEIHESLRALTRLGDPSVDVVCLFGSEDRPTLDRAGTQPVALNQVPDRVTAAALLKRGVGIGSRSVVGELLQQAVPKAWAESPYLPRHRVLFFGTGGIHMGRTTLHLDEELGVVLER